MRRAGATVDLNADFDNNDFVVTQHKAAQEPDSYDIYDQCFHNLDIVWYWRAIQPIAISRIALWDEINDLTKTGQIGPSARMGQGDVPARKLYVQPSLALGDMPTDRISMLPTTHNFDSFAYRAAMQLIRYLRRPAGPHCLTSVGPAARRWSTNRRSAFSTQRLLRRLLA